MTNQKESGNRTAQQNRHREGSEKEIVLVRQLLLTDVVQRSQRVEESPFGNPLLEFTIRVDSNHICQLKEVV